MTQKSILGAITQVKVDLIQQYPGNPRVGDIEAIKESLSSNYQFIPLVVQLSTGYILAGNHTYQAACELGWEEIAVVYIDVDDAHAKRILVAANHIADLGTYDETLLAAILADIKEEDEDLLGSTGYSTEEVDALIEASMDFDISELTDESEEDVGFAASVLDRIMPPSERDLEDEDEDEDMDVKPVSTSTSAVEPPEEYVIFRFGELRAKVKREAYDRFVTSFLKGHKGNLSVAGPAAAEMLGLDSGDVQPAIALGAERWM